MTAEFLDRLEAGEPAWGWLTAQKADRPSAFIQGPALFIGLNMLELRIARLEAAAGLPPLKRERGDVTEEGRQVEDTNDDELGEEFEIHETATLAGADTPVPGEIEERLDKEGDDETKEIEG